MEVSSSFPGTQFSSQHHHVVFMRGNTPLTERLLKPALIDAQSGELTCARCEDACCRSRTSGDYGSMRR